MIQNKPVEFNDQFLVLNAPNWLNTKVIYVQGRGPASPQKRQFCLYGVLLTWENMG